VEASAAARTGKAKGEPKPEGAVVTSMVDALEDILKWERASERAIRVAAVASEQHSDPSATDHSSSN
jgi:hypothetical protein